MRLLVKYIENKDFIHEAAVNLSFSFRTPSVTHQWNLNQICRCQTEVHEILETSSLYRSFHRIFLVETFTFKNYWQEIDWQLRKRPQASIIRFHHQDYLIRKIILGFKRWHQRIDEPTCRCHQNPFIGALGIQEPVILREPQIIKKNMERLAFMNPNFSFHFINH